MRWNEQAIADNWEKAKSFMGHAWHSGKQVLGTVDRYANLATRLLGAAAASGLSGRALESGIQAVDSYSRIRDKAMNVGREVEGTVNRFKRAAPELNL